MKEKKEACDVNTCMLCRQCLDDWRPAVSAKRQNFLFKKGQAIFKEGEKVSGIFFIYEGNVKVHKRWDEEKEFILRFARKGDILGHLGLGDDPIYPISATALSSVTVCYFPLSFFESSLHVNSGFSYKLLRFFANELQDAERRMRNMVHMPVKARIAQAVISLKRQFGVDEKGVIQIELNRQDIASFAGAAYETLFKVTNELASKNILKFNGKSLVLLNEEGLINEIEGERL